MLPPDFVKEESWRGNRADVKADSGVVINNLGRSSIILLATFTGFALGFAVFSYIGSIREAENVKVQQEYARTQMNDAKEDFRTKLDKAETETRMLEYYVMELDGKLMNAGVVDPSRSWSAQKRKREEAKK